MGLAEIITRFLAQGSLMMAILAISVAVVYWLLRHPESAQKTAANLQNLAEWVRKQLMRFTDFVSRKVRGIRYQRTINGVIGNVNTQTHSEIPKARVHVAPTIGSFCPYANRIDGVVNVFIEDSGDDNLNLMNATATYLKEGLIRNLRPLVRNIATAVDLVVIMRILRERNKKGLCADFWNNRFPEQTANQEVKGYVDDFLSQEEKGIFSGMTLSVMEYVNGSPFYNAIAASEKGLLAEEVVDFIAFSTTITNRKRGQQTRLNFEGKYIRIGVLLVGSPLTRLFGLGPYVDRVKRGIQEGVQRVYVIAVGKDNVEFAKRIALENVEGANMVRDFKVFRPSVLNFEPTIVSLLCVARAK